MTLYRVGRTLGGHRCDPPAPKSHDGINTYALIEGDLFQCDECGKWCELVAGEWVRIWGFTARRRLRRARDTITT